MREKLSKIGRWTGTNNAMWYIAGLGTGLLAWAIEFFFCR